LKKPIAGMKPMPFSGKNYVKSIDVFFDFFAMPWAMWSPKEKERY
jgi:hypothetical protein